MGEIELLFGLFLILDPILVIRLFNSWYRQTVVSKMETYQVKSPCALDIILMLACDHLKNDSDVINMAA